MKIIDVNLSIGGRDSEGQLIDSERLLSVMGDFRVSHGVCYHQYAKLDPKYGNTIMAEISKHSGGKLGVCAVLDPVLGEENLPGEGDLKARLEQFQPEAIRIFPDECRVPFHPFYWGKILDVANALSLPLIVDCSYSGEFLTRLPDITAQYPQVKFILVGHGFCNSRSVFPLLTMRNNVYFTIERMLDNLLIEEIYEVCGCGNLLFGSSYPLRSPAGALGLALYANIPAAEREKILSKNWEEMQI